MGQLPWNEWLEPGQGKPRVGSALGCFVCGGAFVIGVAVLALEAGEAITTGALPDEADLLQDLFALGVILLMGGLAGAFLARWALSRGSWPGRLIPTLVRVSWVVWLVGLGVMTIAVVCRLLAGLW